MPREPHDDNAFIVESKQVKNVVRVTAIDPKSGIEATIITPLRVSQRHREQLAARKLRYVLDKKFGDHLNDDLEGPENIRSDDANNDPYHQDIIT